MFYPNLQSKRKLGNKVAKNLRPLQRKNSVG